jgi:hypothetical protein
MNNKYYNCGKPGHRAKDCRSKKKEKKDRDKQGGEESNMVDQLVMFMADVLMDEEMHNFDMYDASNSTNNDECLIYYNWIADTGTTLHICSNHNSYTNYSPIINTSILGAGGKRSPAIC